MEYPPNTINRRQYNTATRRYWDAVNMLPLTLQEICPNFEDFVTSSGSWIRNYHSSYDWIELTPEGMQHYLALQSEHAPTLVAVWATKRHVEETR